MRDCLNELRPARFGLRGGNQSNPKSMDMQSLHQKQADVWRGDVSERQAVADQSKAPCKEMIR